MTTTDFDTFAAALIEAHPERAALLRLVASFEDPLWRLSKRAGLMREVLGLDVAVDDGGAPRPVGGE